MKPAGLNSDDFFAGLIKFCGGKITGTEDLERIVTLAFNAEKLDELKDLAFNAKYITGLTRIIQNKDNNFDEEYFSRIKEEYGTALKKVKIQISDILETGSEFIKEIFNNKYFALTQESLGELNRLCEDLGRLKSYLNSLEEGGKGF